MRDTQKTSFLLLRENSTNEERFCPISRVPLKERDEHSLTDPLHKGDKVCGVRSSARLAEREQVPQKGEGKP
jgi:hypothetical protein